MVFSGLERRDAHAARGAAVVVSVRSDVRDQTEACLVGCRLLGLWKPTAAPPPPSAAPLDPEAVERVR